MKVNPRSCIFTSLNPTTHEGAPAVEVSPYERLKRTVLATMLFEDNFYEDGVKAVDRIKELCGKCTCNDITILARVSAEKYHLRHIPLLMIVEALKKPIKCDLHYTIEKLITRPDMITDLVALYWRDGKKPLANQLKKGLAKAFCKFDEYQLGKYNRDNKIKLRDVLFLCHAKPKDDEQAALWKRLVNKELKTADTWETRLSAGQDKQESFQQLLESHKMGKLAILRNLRNMMESGVSKDLVASELLRNTKEMLPFQYLAAARECPAWEEIIDPPMVASCALKPKMTGKTIVLIDVSISMDYLLSNKGTMKRIDAACGLSILLRECLTEIAFFTFSNQIVMVPPRHGMALRDAIVASQPHSGTYLGLCIRKIQEQNFPYDRMIVITDEQTADTIPNVPRDKKHYILNIANYQNGIGNRNQWVTISGFSEASIDYIREFENQI